MTQRIFCIGRNYVEHIRELGHPEDGDCVIFMKPSSCLVPSQQPLLLPEGRGSVHHEAELVVKIGQTVRNVSPDDATMAIDSLALGLDLTLRDEQNRLRKAGKPWELAKAFDHAAPIGDFSAFKPDIDLEAIRFGCKVNGTLRQQGDTAHMIFSIPRIINILSSTWTLLPGDLIYTGTPAGVGPLQVGDQIMLEGTGLKSAQWTISADDAPQKIG